MRKAFPSHPLDVSRADFATLAAWYDECAQQRMAASVWTLAGIQWRRAASLASREYTTRLLAHTGVRRGVCDQCQTNPVTTHVAYQPITEPHFAHFCAACAPNAAPGWLTVTTFHRK